MKKLLIFLFSIVISFILGGCSPSPRLFLTEDGKENYIITCGTYINPGEKCYADAAKSCPKGFEVRSMEFKITGPGAAWFLNVKCNQSNEFPKNPIK